MGDHDDIRLETKEGTTVAYLAPNFEFEESWTNDTIDNALPGEEAQAQIIDLDQWIGEVTLQGGFMHSDNLPDVHRQALFSISDFSDPVTARQQANRLLKYSVFGFLVSDTTGPYNLYVNNTEFTTQDKSGISIDGTGGVLPNVALNEIRTPEEAGLSRNQYLLRFGVGFVSGD